MRESSGRFKLILLLAMAGTLLWGGWKWWELRRYRRAMVQIEEEIENGLHALAARNLIAVLADNPDSDEAHFLLGNCEAARGRSQAATSAWSHVRPDSRFAPQAILGNMQIEMERGRLGEAERIITDALADPRIDSSSLPILLGPVYCQQGRVEETLKLIEVRWEALRQAGEGDSEPAVNLVRAHVELRQNPVPVDTIRFTLDQAERLAPDDDRIVLGKANLAMRNGLHDEAGRLLEVCRRRRPDDVAVWRARLDWAVATRLAPEARECLKHLPADESTPAQVHKLTAWFAARQRDQALEKLELERLIDSDPTDFPALDRLEELLLNERQPDRAADLRSKKLEVERLLARYQKLYKRNQPRRDAVEMAHLAGQLGQLFEARGFLTLAAALDPDRPDLRDELAASDDRRNANRPPGRMLADLIVPRLGGDQIPPAHLTSGPDDRHSRSN
jgi:enediyne biosynthesis protein E4